MTAILGAYSFSQTHQAAALTARMLTDRYFSGVTDKKERTEYLSFVSVDANDRAVVCESEGSVIALLGTLFLPNGKRLTGVQTFQTEFIPLFRADPVSFLAGCDGAFCFAYYDKPQGSLFLSKDPFGNFPFYYSITKDTVLFATRQRPIALAINAAISQDSVGQVIQTGTILGSRSFYEGVCRLDTASISEINKNGIITTRKYFSPSYSYRKQSEIPELVTQIGDRLLMVLNRELAQKEKAGVALTGGFDSRATLAILLGAQKANDLFFFTHGAPGSYDMEIASQLSRVLRLHQQTLVFDNKTVSDSINHFDTVVDLSEGGLGIEAALSITAMKWQGTKFNSVFDSHGGQLYRRTIFKARSRMLEKDLIGGITRFMASILSKSPFLLKESSSLSRQSGVQELDNYFSALPEHLTTGDKIDRFFIDRLCNNKYSNIGAIQTSYTRLVHPLLDRQTAELLSQIPEGFRRKNLVYKRFFESLAPELMKFPLENNGFKIPFNGYRWKRYVPQSLELLFKKVGIRFSLQRPITSVELIMNHGRNRAQELLLENLALVADYIDTNNLERNLTKNQLVLNSELAALTNFALLMKYLKGK